MTDYSIGLRGYLGEKIVSTKMIKPRLLAIECLGSYLKISPNLLILDHRLKDLDKWPQPFP